MKTLFRGNFVTQQPIKPHCVLIRSLGNAVLFAVALHVTLIFGLLPSVVAQERLDDAKLFEVKDLNGSKSLDKEEFSGGTVGKMREKSDTDFSAKDIDQNGELSLEEFVKKRVLTEEQKKEEETERFKKEFLRIDKDKNGKISREEYVGTAEGKEKTNRIDTFDAMNKDSNDALTNDEFVNRPDLMKVPKLQFYNRDKNHDEVLTLDEFNFFEKGQPSEAFRAKAFGTFDRNRSGDLSLDEFTAYEDSRRIAALPKDQQQVARYDPNGDGSITLAEFTKGDPVRLEKSAKLLFLALDQNGDGNLNLEELRTIDGELPKVVFAKRDVNGDSEVSLEEELDARYAIGKPYEAALRKDFQCKDQNGNGRLTVDEFMIERDDPRYVLKSRDTDQDGELSKAEFLADRNSKDAEKKESENKWWASVFRGQDANFDGKLTLKELGIGKDDSGFKFRQLDIDGNRELSDAEFLVNELGKKWESHHRKRFVEHDKDKSGTLSLEEYQTTDANAIEEKRINSFPPEERLFARLDRSKDSALSIAEFVSRHGENKYVKAYEDRLFRVLDNDGDSLLSVNEFLSRNDSSPSIVHAKLDSDGNEDLTLEEFKRGVMPETLAQEEKAFAEFDLDKSGGLSLDEYVKLHVSRTGRQRWGAIQEIVSSPMSWGTAIFVVLDIVLLVLIGRSLLRRFSKKEITSGETKPTAHKAKVS